MINPFISLRSAAAQLREVNARTGLGTPRLASQILEMRFINGTARAEYFKYRLWRPELTEAERLSYTVQRERRQSESATNWNGRTRSARNKSSFATQLLAAGIPMPELLAKISLAGPTDLRSRADLQDLLQREGVHPLVIKPEDGMQGQGVLVIAEADRSGVTTLAGQRIGADELWSRLSQPGRSGWLIERWVTPHAQVAGWRPGATPTVRILTLITGGQALVHAASIKVPVGTSGLDNLAQGNLAAAVDLESGVVGLATDGTGMPWYERHPESNVPIAGITIPGWSEILAAALHGAGLLLPHRAIGWDVAVGASGPVVIEANTKWCEKLIQLPAGRGLTRGPFIRLLHEMHAGHLLARRRLVSREWREFESRALAGGE